MGIFVGDSHDHLGVSFLSDRPQNAGFPLGFPVQIPKKGAPLQRRPHFMFA